MKNTKLLFVTVVSGLLVAGCCTHQPPARQWEYKVLTAHLYGPLQSELTKAGLEGWEVVSVVNRDVDATAVLKRLKK